MSGRLKDRIALITGASRGIGAEVAKAYAAEGAHVVLTARTTGGLEEVDDAIQAAGGTATLLPLDLKKLDELDKIGPSLAERFGKLDIFVGNAGVLGELSPVAHSDPKSWDEAFTVNVMANYRLIRTLDPLLRGSDAGRAIFVTTGAVGAEIPFWGCYAASKAALEEMVRSYAAETAKTNLRVNLLDPGVVRTSMRALAFPGEDPNNLPPPETIMGKFIDLADAGCKAHGKILKAA